MWNKTGNMLVLHDTQGDFTMRRLLEETTSAVVVLGFIGAVLTWSAAFAG